MIKTPTAQVRKDKSRTRTLRSGLRKETIGIWIRGASRCVTLFHGHQWRPGRGRECLESTLPSQPGAQDHGKCPLHNHRADSTHIPMAPPKAQGATEQLAASKTISWFSSEQGLRLTVNGTRLPTSPPHTQPWSPNIQECILKPQLIPWSHKGQE